MPISTPLTVRLGIQHPILSAPMDFIAGAPLTAAVSAAGGFGILGGGYGDRAWLEQEAAKLAGCLRSLRHRLHHLEPCEAAGAAGNRARSRAARDHAFVRRSETVCAAHQVVGRAADLPGAGRGDGAAGSGCRRRHSDRAGDGSRRPWRVAHHHRHRAGDRRSCSRPGAGRGGRRYRRWPRARRDDDVGRFRGAAGHALLCQSGMRRPRGSETAHLRRDQRQQHPRHYLRPLAQQRMAGAVYRPLPDQRSCAALDGPRGRATAKRPGGRRRIRGGEGGGKFRHCRRHCRRGRRPDP